MFNVFLGFDNSPLLTVKYCIHGAVPVLVDQKADPANLHPYVKKDDYSQWLSERLMKTNVIEKDEMGIGFKDNHLVDEFKLAGDVRSEVKMLAKMIAEWYNISCFKSKRQILMRSYTKLPQPFVSWSNSL